MAYGFQLDTNIVTIFRDFEKITGLFRGTFIRPDKPDIFEVLVSIPVDPFRFPKGVVTGEAEIQIGFPNKADIAPSFLGKYWRQVYLLLESKEKEMIAKVSEQLDSHIDEIIY